MENKIKDLISSAYLEAARTAEKEGVSVEDFRLWVQQASLGLFISANFVGMDETPYIDHLYYFKENLSEFYNRTEDFFKQGRKDVESSASDKKVLTVVSNPFPIGDGKT